MLPQEYLSISQCPNFILEEPGRTAEFLDAYQKNMKILFEKIDSMQEIGPAFKERVKAVITQVE